ncbi:uncharacterized protein LOC124365567 [Homalodisca vitripennis]|uniref:uncharacterized protein LOC124365567 n=1 Tax=Homalodisca vitripennis TaxID=197043 RepID=UPI001EEA5755|nr:uncharacterized protein LOC124365567 [Homalodisca vitripennis]
MFPRLIKNYLMLSGLAYRITEGSIIFGRLNNISVFRILGYHQNNFARIIQRSHSKMSSDLSDSKTEMNSEMSEPFPSQGSPEHCEKNLESCEPVSQTFLDKGNTEINLEKANILKPVLKTSPSEVSLCAVVSVSESESGSEWKSVGTQCNGSSDEDCIVVFKQAWSEGEEEVEEDTALDETDNTIQVSYIFQQRTKIV